MKNIPFTIESDNTLDLKDLLPTIPVELRMRALHGEKFEKDSEKLLKDIGQAAENASSPLALGISAIGEALACSAESITPEAVKNLGWLIESLGKQLFTLNSLQEDAQDLLKQSQINNSGFGGGLMS
ncbi:hypothetical protein [Acinetobacter soli]|uniref:hypothetical protein n=1 Tax=Acinetobacter soli TaxID=487316 RepID=UPI001F41070D|nr:hypothetical protein [Acinetobacter soli]MCE6007566.1 hypothetical protein [Acinetobacter soli]